MNKKSQSGSLYHLSHGQCEPDGLISHSGGRQRPSQQIAGQSPPAQQPLAPLPPHLNALTVVK
jgi:hypothetical protein